MIDEFTRKMREDYYGSSDAPAACGKSPYQTPYDLWALKTKRVKGFAGNQYTEAGTYFEPAVLNWLADRIGAPIQRDQSYFHPDGIRCANLDGLILADHEPALVEVKTAGMFSRYAAIDDWGEDGSADVPQHVLIQIHHQFAVLDAQEGVPPVRLALVPVFIGMRGFALFRVPRNDELMEAVAERVTAFHLEYVKPDQPPPDSLPSMDVLRRLARVPKKIVDLPTDLVARWRTAKATLDAATEEEEAAKGAVLAALGDAEAGDCEIGRVTYFEQSRAGYEVKPATFRVARFKESKVKKQTNSPKGA